MWVRASRKHALSILILGFTLSGCTGTQSAGDPEKDASSEGDLQGPCTSNNQCLVGPCEDGVCTGENETPFAAPGPDLLVATGTKTRVFGWDSGDMDGDPLTYHWSFTEQPEGANAAFDDPTKVITWAKLDVIGQYTVRLVVHDGTEESAPSFLNIEVREPDFWLTDYFTWLKGDVEQIFRNNIRYERHRFEFTNEDLGFRQTVDGLVTETEFEPRTPFFSMGPPHLKWVDNEGLVLTRLEMSESVATLVPPLVIYPHGIFVDEFIVSRSMSTVESPSGETTETSFRSRVKGVVKGLLETTTGQFPDAIEIDIAIETGVDLAVPSKVWLSPGLGEVRILRPNSDEEVPRSMIELAWSSSTNTPPPPMNISVGEIPVGQNMDADFWQSVTPIWRDLAEDVWDPGETLGIDLSRVLLAHDNTTLWIRIDIADPPLAQDASYSLDIAQSQPVGTAGDFTVYVQMQQGQGWYHSINQEAEIGSPFSIQIENSQVHTTEDSLTFGLSLDIRGSENLPTLQEVVNGGYVRSSVCLFKENHCSDQLISSVRITLD